MNNKFLNILILYSLDLGLNKNINVVIKIKTITLAVDIISGLFELITILSTCTYAVSNLSFISFVLPEKATKLYLDCFINSK